jgi:hypothetical protein
MTMCYETEAERWLLDEAQGLLHMEVPDPRWARALLRELERVAGGPESVRLVAGRPVPGYVVEGYLTDAELWWFPDGTAVATHWRGDTLRLDALDADGVGWAALVDSEVAIEAALTLNERGSVRSVLAVEVWIGAGRSLPVLTQEQVVEILTHPSQEVRLAAIAAVGQGGHPFAGLQAALDAGMVKVGPGERPPRRRIRGLRTRSELSREEQARLGGCGRRKPES